MAKRAAQEQTAYTKSPFVGIAGSLGGTLMISLIVVALAAESQFAVMVPIAWAFVVLGIVLGAYAYKSEKAKR